MHRSDAAYLHERRVGEPPPTYRSEGGRDRDRVLYTSAFTRLAGVSQVAYTGSGPALHNRLTHSLKVAQIAHRLAERLNATATPATEELTATLDPWSVEAAALAHDLGHPPFGHVAERELDRLSADVGGFDANAQSLRIVTRLAVRSAYDGINLTRQTLDGILKYPWLRSDPQAQATGKCGAYDADAEAFAWVREGREDHARSLVAEIVDWADDITYAVHDVEDFFRAGLIPLDRLTSRQLDHGPLIQSILGEASPSTLPRPDVHGATEADLEEAADALLGKILQFRQPYGGSRWERAHLTRQSSELISHFLSAFILAPEEDGSLIHIDMRTRAQVTVLKHLTWHYVIHSPALSAIREGQRRTVRGLFEHLAGSVAQRDYTMFGRSQADELRAAESDELRLRIVLDNLSGLTEARAIEIFRRLSGMSGARLPGPMG